MKFASRAQVQPESSLPPFQNLWCIALVLPGARHPVLLCRLSHTLWRLFLEKGLGSRERICSARILYYMGARYGKGVSLGEGVLSTQQFRKALVSPCCPNLVTIPTPFQNARTVSPIQDSAQQQRRDNSNCCPEGKIREHVGGKSISFGQRSSSCWNAIEAYSNGSKIQRGGRNGEKSSLQQPQINRS